MPASDPPKTSTTSTKVLQTIGGLLIAILPLVFFMVRVHGCGASGWGMSLLRAFGAFCVAWLAAILATIVSYMVMMLVGGVKFSYGVPQLRPWGAGVVMLASFAAWLATVLRMTRC